MPESELSPVRQALLDYSRGQADRYRVLRALIDHDAWLVPTAVMQRCYSHASDETLYPGRKELYVLGEQTILPPGKFLLFTDFPAAMRAQYAGIPMGPLTGGVSGLAIFSNIDRGWDEVVVNAGSPVEESWFEEPGPSGTFEARERFTRQIGFERKLASADDENLVELIRAAEEPFGTLLLRTGRMLSEITESGFGLMLFTTPDCVEAARQALANSGLMEGASLTTLPGTIVDKIPGDGVIGIVINAYGPGPKVELWWQ